MKIPFLVALLSATAIIVGCGDQKDPRLSDADIMAMKQARLQAIYGGGNSVTKTDTVVQYVNVTSVTTVNQTRQ